MGPSDNPCKVCDYGVENFDGKLSNRAVARIIGCAESTVRLHKLRGCGEAHALKSVWEAQGKGGEVVTLRSWRIPEDGGDASVPDWPVIDRPSPRKIKRKIASAPLIKKWKTAVAGADTQIGFRRFDDGTMDPFHDDKAMALFNALVEIENPDMTLLCGDILDLPENGRFAQEAAFANTLQASLDRTYEWLVDIRSKTTGTIDLIEGNHDRRLQNFVELNAKAAFGLRVAGWPESWPVMSLPHLLRLDELDIAYQDAYPNAVVWVNNILRAEHGTKVNSNGSTAQKYLSDTPHISRLFGHTHRQEIVQRTTWDRMGKIRTQAINPGCLCRVDGAVPGVHSSVGVTGRPSTVFEDWQQGAAIIRYTDDQFFTELVQFDDGVAMYQGQELVAA